MLLLSTEVQSLPQVAETNTPRMMDAAGEYLLYYESRRNVPSGL